jgi:membrane protease YdiL (CAAX protease family)
MILKGAFKNSGGFVQFLLFAGIITIGIAAGSVVSAFLISVKADFNAETVARIMSDITAYPARLREMQFISQLGAFLVPALLTAYLFSNNYKDYLYLNTPFNGAVVFWTVMSVISIFPFLNLMTQLNRQMVLPDFLKSVEEYMKSAEENNTLLIESMLRAENMWAIVFNVLVIAVFAAVGEEFLFRGALQRIIGGRIRNKHVVVWTVAFVFSFIHFQFYGFIPRLLFGAYFGYLLYFTKNLWIPVIAHFVHNFTGVILFTLYSEDAGRMEAIDALGTGETWWLSAVSLGLFVYTFRRCVAAFRFPQ